MEAQFEEHLAEMKAQAEAQSAENFNAVQNWINDSYAQISEATSQPMPVMMQEVYVPEESTPTRMEQMLNDVRDKIISYGYEPEVVEGWMMEAGEEWQALDQKQTEEAMSLHQGQVQEAADYVKPILDAMIADMKAEHAAAQAE